MWQLWRFHARNVFCFLGSICNATLAVEYSILATKKAFVGVSAVVARVMSHDLPVYVARRGNGGVANFFACFRMHNLGY